MKNDTKVIYMNECRTPFTIYCQGRGYLKGFNRVVDIFSYISSNAFTEFLTEQHLEEDMSKSIIEVIEHLQEHGKKDKIIAKFKALDVLKSRFDNII